MKNTGIIRRIDDLGRILIPKEIRRALGIIDGDPIEFFYEDDMICLKKYKAEGDIRRKLSELDAVIQEEDLDPYKKGELRRMIRDMEKVLKEINHECSIKVFGRRSE